MSGGKSSSSNATETHQYDQRVVADGGVVATGNAVLNMLDGGAVDGALNVAEKAIDKVLNFTEDASTGVFKLGSSLVEFASKALQSSSIANTAALGIAESVSRSDEFKAVESQNTMLTQIAYAAAAAAALYFLAKKL